MRSKFLAVGALAAAALAAVAASTVAFGPGEGRAGGLFLLGATSWDTDRCRVTSVVPSRPHPGTEPGFTEWRPPSGAMIRLTDLPGTITGEPPEGPGWLAHWSADEISGWTHEVHGQTYWLRAPTFDPPLPDATRVRVVLRPGTARQLALLPSPVEVSNDRIRTMRQVAFSLDEPSSADAEVVVTASIEEALTGNWGDDGRRAQTLRTLEIGLPRVDQASAEVLEVIVEGAGAEYAGKAAGTAVVDLRGELHPAWFVQPGASVRLPVHVPDADHPELRWLDGHLSGRPIRKVVIHGEGRSVLVSQLGTSPRAWTPKSISLEKWRDQDIEIELANDGEGLALWGSPRVSAPEIDPNTPNVLVYLIDTLRADHVGAFGSPVPGVSPRIDQLAEQGAAFGLAISSSPWTKPAIPTLFSGLWPTTHTVGATSYTDMLPPTVPMLQERFTEAGWRTGSFSASPLGSTLSALERGFDTALPPHHWRGRLTTLRHVAAPQLHDAFEDWYLQDPDEPFFAYVQTLEVHGWRRSPYEDPPPGYTSYDYAVQDADTRLGELLDTLEQHGVLSNTLVVVLSDHGESFGDHGVSSHGKGVWQSQVHIPLVMWAPGKLPPITITDPVGLADVAPTLLDLVGLEPLPDADGTSLVPYFKGPTEPVHDWVPSARIRYVWQPNDPKHFGVVDNDQRKLIRIGRDEHTVTLTDNLCEGRTSSEIPADLRVMLDRWLSSEVDDAAAFEATHGAAHIGEVDAGDVELLKAMGYLE